MHSTKALRDSFAVPWVLAQPTDPTQWIDSPSQLDSDLQRLATIEICDHNADLTQMLSSE